MQPHIATLPMHLQQLLACFSLPPFRHKKKNDRKTANPDLMFAEIRVFLPITKYYHGIYIFETFTRFVRMTGGWEKQMMKKKKQVEGAASLTMALC